MKNNLTRDVVPGTAEEEWRPIPGYPNYFVSDQGRVWSTHTWRGQSGRFLSVWMSVQGYPTVALSAAGKKRHPRIHTLVAAAFLGPRPDGFETRHLDGDKLNNTPANLRYGTQSENTLDRVIHGTHYWAARTHCGKGHPYDEANTKIHRHRRGGTRRVCGICRREANLRSKERLRLRSAAVRTEQAA